MINVLSAADITFIMSSSTSAWLLSPLECSQKQNGWTLRFCFWGWIMWKMYNKTIIEFGFLMISWIIKPSCLCYLPQPSASADNTDLGYDNSWYAQPHPIIVYYFITLANPLKAYRHYFSRFAVSSACVQPILEYADDVSKLLGYNCMTLLAMLWSQFERFDFVPFFRHSTLWEKLLMKQLRFRRRKRSHWLTVYQCGFRKLYKNFSLSQTGKDAILWKFLLLVRPSQQVYCPDNWLRSGGLCGENSLPPLGQFFLFPVLVGLESVKFLRSKMHVHLHCTCLQWYV